MFKNYIPANDGCGVPACVCHGVEMQSSLFAQGGIMVLCSPCGMMQAQNKLN